MWIRSQLESMLIYSKDIFIDFIIRKDNMYYKICAQEFTLAIYKTKEKAMQVLDDIQDAIEDGVKVFEMPIDE